MIVIDSMMHKKYMNQIGEKICSCIKIIMIFKSLILKENMNKSPAVIQTHDQQITLTTEL